jgi:hypothetical protein
MSLDGSSISHQLSENKRYIIRNNSYCMTQIVKKTSINNAKNKERTDPNLTVSKEHAKNWTNRDSIFLFPKLAEILWSSPSL